jgi:hypothetical protein
MLVLTSSGSSLLPIAVAGNQTVVIPTKFSANYYNAMAFTISPNIFQISIATGHVTNQWMTCHDYYYVKLELIQNVLPNYSKLHWDINILSPPSMLQLTQMKQLDLLYKPGHIRYAFNHIFNLVTFYNNNTIKVN